MPVTIHPAPDDLLTDTEIEPWRDVPVAVAVDLVPDEQIDIRIRPLNPPGNQPRLFGRALTVQCEPPDFGSVLHALELVNPGDVLVIGTAGKTDAAMIGDILSGYLRRRGCAGIVCDGAVRDVATLGSWPDFPVFTRAVNPRGPTAADKGGVRLPVSMGDRLVHSGDLIIGDDDGLVALSSETVRTRSGDARAKLTLEDEWVDALADDRPVADVFGLEPADRK